MKKRLYFLIGVAVGVLLMFTVHSVVDEYKRFNTRLGFVEGYIRSLDKMIRQ